MRRLSSTFSCNNSSQPLYLQLATIFNRRIETGLWPAGEQAPTLDMLMQEFGVGRVTVRSAYAELERQGLLVSSRGKGTFIKALPKAQVQRYVVGTTWKELVDRGNQNEISLERTSDTLARSLPFWCEGDGKAAKQYSEVQRVYSRDGHLVCFSHVFIEAKLFALIKPQLANQAVISVLGNQNHVTLARGHQTITIIAAGDDTVAHLKIPVGSPVAEITRHIYDERNVLVYCARVHYDSRYMKLEFDLFN